MIIGIDASRANEDQKTGVGWYAYFLIQELKKVTSGDIQVILYSRQPLKGELAELPEGWSSKVLEWWPSRLWTQVRLSIEMLFHPPDVLFVPAHVPPPIHPKKTVMMVHDVAALRFPQSYSGFERWLSVRSAKQAVKKLWKVLTPSIFTKNELEELLGSTTSNINVVHHGVGSEYRVISDEGEVQKRLKKYGIQKPFALTIGRLEEKKNTKRVVEAFDGLAGSESDLRLVLVGKAGYGYEEVQRAVGNTKNQERILELGYVAQEDVPYLINAAELIVYPSLYEGFGLVALEAFACGTPVVASKGSSIEEVAGGGAVYVDPMKAEEIVSAMRDLLTDESLRKEKVRLGFERVKQFSWQRCAEETLRVFLS